MSDNFFSLSDLGLLASPSQLLQQWLTAMQAQFPGYTPSTGNLEYIQAQVFASWAAACAQLASAGGTELFRTYGTKLLGLPYENGNAAQAVLSASAAQLTTSLATLSTGLLTSGPITSLPVTALQYAVASGSIVVASGANTQTWTTSGAPLGATTIPVASQTPNFAYPALSTITGTAQYKIPAGTQFALSLGGAPLGFLTSTDVLVNSGSSTQFTVYGVQAGTAFNGAGNPVQAISPLTWTSTLTAVTQSSGGTDPETDDHYLTRLAQTLQLLAPRPITAQDYATMALNFAPLPGSDQEFVGRATAIDGYNPADNSYNNQRMVAVCVTDENGYPLNSDTIYGLGGSSVNIITNAGGWGITGWLQSMREANFIVNVVSPNYTTVYVAMTVVATPGYLASTVQANIQAALLNYLSPLNWGLPANANIGWQNYTYVYRSRVESAIQLVSGVDHIVNGTLAVDVNPSPTNTNTDLALPGAFPLPVSTATSIPLSSINVITS